MGLAGGLRPRVWARLTERLERPERPMDLGPIPLPTLRSADRLARWSLGLAHATGPRPAPR